MHCMVIHYQDIRELDIFRLGKLYIVMGYFYWVSVGVVYG